MLKDGGAERDRSSAVGNYKTSILFKLIALFVVYVMVLAAISSVYYILMNKYIAEMEGFHLFLTTYR
jgi:hypothetical protein